MSLRIVVLISGGGTTLWNLIQYHRQGQLVAELAHVISSRPDAAGLKFAKEYGIPHSAVDSRNYPSAERFSEAIFEACRQAGADLVVLGGFLKRLAIPADFVNRVINIHPSLIPAFCGKGMYGLKVHSAVLDYGCKLSGCTVHFVDNEYDHGAIIAQESVPVLAGDSPEVLAHRVFAAECELYPRIINSIAQNQLVVEGRTVRIN
jgi:phosphoribosylglycinamide formyltransferase-1